MYPKIESELLRLAYRSVLLLVFMAIIIKKDLPLRELPYIGHFFAKK